MFKKLFVLFNVFTAIVCSNKSKALEFITLRTQTDIKDHIKPGMWVFTDFDRVLMAKNIGTPFAYELNPAYTSLLKNLQDEGIPVFGLTARGEDQVNETMKHLKDLGLEFTKSLANANITDLSADRFPFNNTIFKDGILFTPTLKDPILGKKKTKGISLKILLDTFPQENRSVLVIDDQPEQLIAIQNEVQAEGTLAYCPFFGHPLFKSTQLPFDFPVSFEGLKGEKIETAWGRDMMRLKNKKKRKTYLLQTNASNDQMKEEIMALRLYEALGVPVPDYRVLSGRGNELTFKKFESSATGLYLLTSDFILDAPKKSKRRLENSLRDHYVVDAFLSHTGLIRDEYIKQLIENPNGQVIRPAFFSTLRLGRTGKHKNRYLDWSLHQVVELDWFKDNTRSQESAAIYNQLSNTELKDQITKLLSKKEIVLNTFDETNNVLIMQNSQELRQMLEQRFNDLQSRLAGL